MEQPVQSSDLNALLRELSARAEAAELERDVLQKRVDEQSLEIKQNRAELEAQELLITSLMAQLRSATRRLAHSTNKPEQLALKLEMKAIQRRLNDLNRDKFGASSEKRGKGAARGKQASKKTQSGHGPTAQPKLPREEQLHLLDKADQVCPTCTPAATLTPWGDKSSDSEEVTIVERTFKIKVHKRQVYRCDGCGHIEEALGPKRLIDGGRYSPEFAIAVAVDKFRDHIPAERQARRMGEMGLQVRSQTLWNQLERLYVLLLPNYLALQTRILQSELIYADETHWKMIKKGGSKRWWVWLMSDERRSFFMLAPSRGQAAARQMFLGYDGFVMADRYSVYKALEKERTRRGGRQLILKVDGQPDVSLPTPDYELAACWMHGRRGFIKAEQNGEQDAGEALDIIAALYAVESRARERVAKFRDRKERQTALFEVRKELRATESAPLIAKLRDYLDRVRTVPSLQLEKAVLWLNNGWTELTRFLHEPQIPLDNGLAERQIRGVVLGRKNYAGCRSEAGTQVAALFYSLVETCILEGVDVRKYLLAATMRALEDRESVFLPEDFAALNSKKAVK